MARRMPDAVEERDFQKVLRGYDPAQVDAYINKITENYAELYRYACDLEHQYAMAKERLMTADSDREEARRTLETSRAAADKIISDAYERSDAILASIKRSCDKILGSFKAKIETQRTSLDAMRGSIAEFKNDLYQRYRLHIEMLDRLSPAVPDDEELSPEEYVEKVVSTMNQEISAEYGISLSGFDADEFEDDTPAVTEKAAVFEAKVEKPETKAKPKSRRNRKQEVIKLIDEREMPAATGLDGEPAVQMLFDFDGTPGELSDKE